jgi:hypothetical protein
MENNTTKSKLITLGTRVKDKIELELGNSPRILK